MDRPAFVLALLLASTFALAQPALYEEAQAAERAGDRRAAVKLYTQAAQKGDGKAAYRLGEIYEKGLGVTADQAAAQKWFNAARTLGYPTPIGDFPNRPGSGSDYGRR